MRHTGRLHSYIRGIHSQEVPRTMAAAPAMNHRQDSASIVSASEETWGKPSSQFPSYASYQRIFSGFVRSLDANSSLFMSQQNRNSGGSQELNDNVARSSSASTSQQSSVCRLQYNDFPTHKSQSDTKQLDTLSSLQSSSIPALKPLSYKDYSQLSSHAHNVTNGSVIKPTTSKDNPQRSIQGIDSAVSNRPVTLASLCRHDSSTMAATTNKQMTGSTIIMNGATVSSNCHSETPMQNIKSQVNGHNPETFQVSLCKQISSTVESGTMIISNNNMSILVATSRRDAQDSMNKIGILSTNSFGFATVHDSSTAVPLISKSHYNPSRSHHYRKHCLNLGQKPSSNPIQVQSIILTPTAWDSPSLHSMVQPASTV
jgi:hypothetical protein